MYKYMAAVLQYAAEVSEILGFLIVLAGTCVPVRKWIRERRRGVYRPRHARSARSLGRGGRHRLNGT
jgi:hypothetical protein